MLNTENLKPYNWTDKVLAVDFKEDSHNIFGPQAIQYPISNNGFSGNMETLQELDTNDTFHIEPVQGEDRLIFCAVNRK